MKFIVWISVLIFLICKNISFSQHALRFKNYTISNGLSQSSAKCVIQDKYGFIWVGTQDGLNKFDGSSFQIYTAENTKGIQNSYINTAFKSKQGDLWFGTANGLTFYQADKELFKTFSLKNESVLQIQSIDEDYNGNIWLGTSSNGVKMFDSKKQNIFSPIQHFPSNKILSLSFISKNTLLISTEDKGSFVYELLSKKLKAINIEGKEKAYVRVNTIKNIAENEFLLGTNQGVYLFNSASFKCLPYITEIDANFGSIEINDILIQSKSKYFFATQTSGLISVEKKGSTFQIYNSKEDIFQKNALLYNEVNQLFKDKTGLYWVATERGFGSFNPNNKGFMSIEPSGDLSIGLPSSSVWCFKEEKSGKYIFIGTDNAVSRKNVETGKFEQFFRDKNEKLYVEKNDHTILSLFVFNKNHLFVGTTEGLYELKIGSTTNYTFSKITFNGIKNPSKYERIYHISHWKNQLYFIATKGGLILYDKVKNKFTPFEYDPKNPQKSIADGACRYVFKSNEGRVLVPTSIGGLNELVEKNNNLYFKPFAQNNLIKKATKDYITSILQISKHEFYFSTMGSGFIYFNENSGTYKVYNKTNGLPNNVVYGIVQDGQQNLWMSTNKGIVKFNLFTKKLSSYSEVDGLVSSEFNQGAFLKSSRGIIYFGSINWYNFFNPKSLSNENKTTNVIFTHFKLDKEWLSPSSVEQLFNANFSTVKQLNLRYKQRNFTIKFMPEDFTNPALVSYKYILIGADEGEIFIGNSNQIHFNSLDPGEYVLKVYAKMGNSVWSPEPATIEINLAAPFWRKTWFWLLSVFFIGIFILVFTRKRIEAERRQQVRLEMKIAERTREIREQNLKIEKQKQKLEEKKNEVEEQKRLLEIEKEKSEKLLKNIIPESTVNELKTMGKASARAYKTVSVMFTDFVGFTKISENLSPSELVSELDIYFRAFDKIIVKNNLEKIKTIGDAYMCAGGVPVRNNTNPIDTCLAALQIQDCMVRMRKEAESTGRVVWDLRLGINTGEVTAGVIGTEKFAYDIWGSTVNQAQRMEMLGEANKVTISGETFNYIEPYFLCTFKGKVKSKSKGLIDMYTVDSIKPELSIDGKGLEPNERFHQIVNLHHYSSINYYKAERHIMKVLEKKLSPKLHYHCIAHTKDVCRAVERIALMEGVTDEGLFLLKSAATYHDAGFVESYEKNEPVGARMAGEILPKYGYTDDHIAKIRELIYVTQIPHQPKNKLEEIICDADLDYLGRDDFHKIADKLRLELREHGKIDSDRKWDEIQVMFLTQHQYFTETAKATRQEKKMKNLEEIKTRLENNEYVD